MVQKPKPFYYSPSFFERMMDKKELGYKSPILLGVLAVLNLIDWVMTDYAIKRGATELNPISRWLMEKDLFNEVKFGGVMFALLGSTYIGWAESRGMFEKYVWVYNVLAGVIVIAIINYIIVLFNNIMQLTLRGPNGV